jgi:amino acid transporter/nucleotide-binding universal stress UspA family protein
VPAELERDLSLYATITISIGAMVGSGIFVLPGLASKIAGPAVVLAYLLAGLLVLPAALAKAEMATAMPEAGGTYLYIDRAMGPLPGTVAGVGAWFSLVFKSAFALVGLGAYLVLFVDIPAGSVTMVALGLAGLLLVVNVVGVKQSGRLQAAIVTLVLVSLFLFVGDGLTHVEQARYQPFFEHGSDGLFAATGFVFVSYAGVTKIASVAEEVENPGRNIPLGILSSVVAMILLYTLVIFVVVGVSPPDELVTSLTPMALAAESFLGRPGQLVIAVVAVLALTSMANAGVLSSSRFPLAMSRDALAPPILGRVSDRYRTPVASIAVTGAVLLALIAFVPVVELAKLASAFKILVFTFVNVALVAFRESELESYQPEFVAPGYPWVPLAGIAGGLVLLTQMGTLPMVGAVALVVTGAVWYRIYGRERTEREGAAFDAIRRESTDRAIARTRRACESADDTTVLVPFGRVDGRERRQHLLEVLHLAADVVEPRGGTVQVVRFEEVPQQVSLDTAAGRNSADDVELEAERGEIASSVDVPVEFGEIVTHDTKRAVANFAANHDTDLILGEWHPSRWRAELLGVDVDWYMRHAPCDVAFVRNRGFDDVERVLVAANDGPFDPLEVTIADSLAMANGATVEFLATLEPSATDEQIEATEDYLAELSGFCASPVEHEVATTGDRLDSLVTAAARSDVVVVGTSAHHILYDVLFGDLPDQLVERVDDSVLMTHSKQPRRATFIRALLHRFLF